MRKGFLHIVEIVIVALMAFLVLMQFSYLPKQNADWGSMKLSIQANDILFSLEKKGVDWFNSTQLDHAISSSVSNNTIYNLKIRNVMKPYINVGCICSVAENTSLAGTLKPFEINGQPVSFSVTQINPSSISFSHDYDVIVDFDYNLTNNYTQVRQFLAADKGIVEFRHLDQSEIDSVQTDFFGLTYSLGTPDGSPVEFRSNQSSEPYFNIYKYFHNIPIFQDNFSSVAGRWSPQTGGSGWSVSGGTYVGTNTTGNGYESRTLTVDSFQDTYSLRGWFRSDSGANHNVSFILYNSVIVNFDVDANVIRVTENSANRGSANPNPALQAGRWYDVKIIPQPDSRLKIYINGSLNLTSNPITIPASSKVGLAVENGQASFDNIRVIFAEKHNFSSTLLQNEKVQPADSNSQKVILLQNNTQLPACIVNSNIVNDKGRTAWLAYSDPAASQDVGNMLKTLVVWAAGDENDVITNDVRNVPVVNSIYKTYSNDMYQPVEIVLTMGNLYG